MTGTESDSASKNPQEEQDMKTMFKSRMKEFKDLKQTVATLMDNSLEGVLNVENDGETSHRSHDKVDKYPRPGKCHGIANTTYKSVDLESNSSTSSHE